MTSISERIKLAIDQVRKSGGILHIEATAQQIAAESGEPARINEIAEMLLREGMHHRIPLEMDHSARSNDGQAHED